MAETLARKTAKRKALRFQFGKLVSEVQSSIENSETPQAKILALKSSLEEVHFNLNNIDEEILNLCDEDEVEKETLESMKVLEPYHFVMAELVSSLEEFGQVSGISFKHLFTLVVVLVTLIASIISRSIFVDPQQHVFQV